MWDSLQTFLLKRKNLNNHDKLPERIKRPMRFQKQQASNLNKKSGNWPYSKNKIPSKYIPTSSFSNLISDFETLLSKRQSLDAC